MQIQIYYFQFFDKRISKINYYLSKGNKRIEINLES